METKIKWNEGEGYITATYEGSGNGSASISSDVNEGIDRTQSVKVETTDKSVSAELVVSQVGLREVFEPSDGLFVLADGGTYNVLKGQIEKPDYSTWRGVFIQSVEGDLYEINQWDSSKEANGVAVQTDDISLVVALQNSSGFCTWGSRSNIAGVSNSDSAATVKTYFNGEKETDAIIANAEDSKAASYCKNTIFPNGQQGFMGSGGEWWICMTLKSEIVDAMKICGGTALSGNYWCTTEQVGSNRAWAADWDDTSLANFNKSSSSSVRTRAFCRLIIN